MLQGLHLQRGSELVAQNLDPVAHVARAEEHVKGVVGSPGWHVLS